MDSSYIKQSVVITKEDKEIMEEFALLLRQHKLDISFSGLLRMLIQCGKPNVKFHILGKYFSLEEFEANRKGGMGNGLQE